MDEKTEVENKDLGFSKEVEQASYAFSHGFPEFKKLLQGINSLNSLARVFCAVLEFPLAKEIPQFKSDAETKLFLAFNEMLQHKSVIMSAFLNEMLNKKGENNVNKQEEVVAQDRDNQEK